MVKVRFGSRVFETELVIFDKDGTLTDFSTSWVPLFEKRIEAVAEMAGLEKEIARVGEELSDAFGIHGKKVDPYGPYPYTTPWEDEVITATVLYRHGVPWHASKALAARAIADAEKRFERTKLTRLHRGVKEAIEALKKHGGLKLSVATTDTRQATLEILENCGVHDLFDFVVCADMVKREKPDPEMVEKTLDALGAARERTVLAGDSIVDMEMGKRAGLGLVVGVLEGGVADAKVLARNADLIIDSVRDISIAG